MNFLHGVKNAFTANGTGGAAQPHKTHAQLLAEYQAGMAALSRAGVTEEEAEEPISQGEAVASAPAGPGPVGFSSRTYFANHPNDAAIRAGLLPRKKQLGYKGPSEQEKKTRSAAKKARKADQLAGYFGLKLNELPAASRELGVFSSGLVPGTAPQISRVYSTQKKMAGDPNKGEFWDIRFDPGTASPMAESLWYTAKGPAYIPDDPMAFATQVLGYSPAVAREWVAKVEDLKNATDSRKIANLAKEPQNTWEVNKGRFSPVDTGLKTKNQKPLYKGLKRELKPAGRHVHIPTVELPPPPNTAHVTPLIEKAGAAYWSGANSPNELDQAGNLLATSKMAPSVGEVLELGIGELLPTAKRREMMKVLSKGFAPKELKEFKAYLAAFAKENPWYVKNGEDLLLYLALDGAGFFSKYDRSEGEILADSAKKLSHASTFSHPKIKKFFGKLGAASQSMDAGADIWGDIGSGLLTGAKIGAQIAPAILPFL